VRGKTYKNLKWDRVFEEFMEILIDYFEERI
jgi:hypothetical protein